MKKVLDLGCGPYKKDPMAIGFDCIDMPGVDVVGDINDTLPFKDNEFDHIIMYSILEHVVDVEKVLAEVYRILKPGGTVFIHVPFFKRNSAFGDVQHKHYFTHASLDYFMKGSRYSYYNTFHFELVKRHILFCKTWRITTLLPHLLQWFANKYPDFYENYVGSFLPAYNIEWTLRKPKQVSAKKS